MLDKLVRRYYYSETDLGLFHVSVLPDSAALLAAY